MSFQRHRPVVMPGTAARSWPNSRPAGRKYKLCRLSLNSPNSEKGRENCYMLCDWVSTCTFRLKLEGMNEIVLDVALCIQCPG